MYWDDHMKGWVCEECLWTCEDCGYGMYDAVFTAPIVDGRYIKANDHHDIWISNEVK
jgi:hypothetical protein